MRILICDDDQEFLSDIENRLLADMPSDTQIDTCHQPEKLYDLLSCRLYHLLLMDICLEGANGIQLARSILESWPNLPVIFITGFPDLYYEKVYLDVRPFGFIKKPVDWSLLLSLIRQIQEDRKNMYRSLLFVRTTKGLESILLKDISYIESRKHNLLIHAGGNPYVIYGKLDQVALKLPDYFFRCHKSFLVNARYIRRYENNCFFLEGDVCIRISQLKAKAIRRQFMQYLEQQEMYL